MRCALVTGVQTCALPIFLEALADVAHEGGDLPLAAEQQKHDGENHQPVPNAQATHRVLRNPVTPPSDAPDYTRPGPRIATQTPCRLQVVPHPANTKIWAGSIWKIGRAHV